VIASVKGGLPNGWSKRLLVCVSGKTIGKVSADLTIKTRGKLKKLRLEFVLFFFLN
jgi:hypothetical protein